MTFDINNKTVLVTGANRGIGRAIVEEAIARGAGKVYAAVRNVDSAATLVAEHGDKVVPIRVDLQDADSITEAAKVASDVDVVINNAGVATNSEALDGDAFTNLEFELDVNLYGLLRIAHAFSPVLKANGGGALVQLNSAVSVKAFSNVATYSASKAASYSMTQSLRESLADQGTHVVSVHPGPIKTDMADSAGFGEIAEPPSFVANAIFDAIRDAHFHAWPDSMAKQIGSAYQSFAENVVEADMSETPT
ncbi:putative oxidoreductase [Stieleria bergensis]|uniref:Putative oxidoreductase n=1 Tax=Stieleria bergensis TaxID=2528025 RepID=A0A517SWY3_9BACT|nr:putative oxidoreductase [Planctomycetes bacterium SV_7m_r]